MRARCKFTVTSVEPTTWSSDPPEIVVRLTTLYDPNDPEDTKFSVYTPSGDMEFRVNNPNVIGMFEEGKSFYVDLTPVKE